MVHSGLYYSGLESNLWFYNYEHEVKHIILFYTQLPMNNQNSSGQEGDLVSITYVHGDVKYTPSHTIHKN